MRYGWLGDIDVAARFVELRREAQGNQQPYWTNLDGKAIPDRHDQRVPGISVEF